MSQADLGVTAEDPTKPPSALAARELAMLDLERSWWKSVGRKESAIRDQFDVSSTVYYLELNALIDRPEALAADPLLVRRLLRLRAARARQRSASRASLVRHEQ